MNKTLIQEIEDLKKKHNAVILAHNYQPDEVQQLADFSGDSFALSMQASKTQADVIVFCGVHFMAETAAILSPEKTVLIPDPASGCPMADMITAAQLNALKAQHPGAVVITYVNSSAAVKAETDICCTSSNAMKVAETVEKDKEIIFVPDKYLGTYISGRLGREFILWDGFCPTHIQITKQDILLQKERHPDAEVLVHPECTPEVTGVADAVRSTEGICRYAENSDARKFIIGTEIGILYRLRKENPGKLFFPASEKAVCPNMKRTTIEKILSCLDGLKNPVRVPDDIANRARASLTRMLSIS